MTREKFDTDMRLFRDENCAHDMYALVYAYLEPKTCHSCVFNEDSFCMHTDVPDGDTIEYIRFSGCGLHQPKEPQ